MKRFFYVIPLLAVSRLAAAQAAVECPGTVWTPTEYTLKIGVDTSSTYPLDPVVGGMARRYDNMLKHTRKFVANKYVNGVAFGFGSFDTEANFDRFTISGAPCSGGSCTTLASMTGSLGATSRVLDYAGTGQSLSSAPLRLAFTSDTSVTRNGIDLDNTLVRCFGSGVSNDLDATLNPGETADGVLLGPNDIVYMALPGGATPGFHQSVALWSKDTSTDMDLLLACGRRPTASDYDVASRTGTNQEFIEWSDATRVCTSGWFLGVHSYAGTGKDGKGAFHLLYSRHKATQHFTLRAAFDTTSCTGGIVTDFAQRADAHAFLTNASAAIYGATDGQVVVNWELYNATSTANDDDPLGPSWLCGGSACNVRLDNCHGGGQTWPPLGDTFWIGSQWHTGDGSHITHEFGHAHIGVGDATIWPFGEDGYWAPVSDPRTQLPSDFPTSRRDLIYNVCGHSVMSNGFTDDQRNKYCTTYNHLHNQRYVAINWETNLLTTNGKLDSEPRNSGVAYGTPIGVTGKANSWSPVLHSTLWTDVSDWQVGIHNGVLWQEPDGSDDPYDFLDFTAPGFPGAIVDR